MSKEKEPKQLATIELPPVQIQPRLAKIEQVGQQLLERVRGISITTQKEYEITGELRKTIKGKLGELEEFIGPIKTAQYAAWKVSCGQENKVRLPLEQADLVLVGIRTKWTNEQERLRQEEIERLRLEAEEKERERVAIEAEERARSGDVEGAMELLEEEVMVPVTSISREVEPVAKQAGFSERKTWSAEVVSLKELVKAVAAGKAPLECLQADMKFLNKQAQAFRGGLSIPGVRSVSRTSESVRGSGV